MPLPCRQLTNSDRAASLSLTPPAACSATRRSRAINPPAAIPAHAAIRPCRRVWIKRLGDFIGQTSGAYRPRTAGAQRPRTDNNQ